MTSLHDLLALSREIGDILRAALDNYPPGPEDYDGPIGEYPELPPQK